MSRRFDETTHLLTGFNLGSTAKAVKFKIYKIDNMDIIEYLGDKKEIPIIQWFPISQIRSSLTNPKSTEVEGLDELRVTEWILEAKGFI